MSRRAHERPEAIAIANCTLMGECRCKLRPGRNPGSIINRRLCEDKYLAAIQTILRGIHAEDAAHESRRITDG